MRLLYLAAIRLPTEKAHGLQIVKTCEALAEAGATVELMIPGRKTAISEDPFSYYGAKKNFTITTLSTPDLVQLGVFGFLTTLFWFSEKAKWSKSFWTADYIYSRDALVLLNYMLLGRRLVYEAHNNPSFISILVAHFATKVITISEGLKHAYVSLGIPKEKITVVPDAVDPNMFNHIPKDVRNSGGMAALYVGRIEKEKGADTFAASSEFFLPHIKAVIVGEGSFKENLQKQFPNVTFLPGTPYRQLPDILRSAQVLVLPNSGQFLESSRNTSPLKLFAYMASGIPIVATDVPAIREILSDDTAVFVPPDDPEALAKGIETALSASEKGAKAKELVKRYSWVERAKQIITAASS